MKTIKIIIDEKLLKEYYIYYFDKYPRRKKQFIKSPNHPSINQWFILKRMAMNTLKQNWKEFGSWVVQYYNCENLNIDKCEMDFEYEYKSKRRHDADNSVPKFLLDAFVDAGLIIDDSCDVITRLTLKCSIGCPEDRTIIYIRY